MRVKPSILLIDEAQLERKINEWTLTRAGYEVFTATNGQQGLRLAQEHTPDVILLDPVLPDISGHQFLAELKRNPRTVQIPVIVLDTTPPSDAGRFEREGAAEVLEKEKTLSSNSLLLSTIEVVVPPVL